MAVNHGPSYRCSTVEQSTSSEDGEKDNDQVQRAMTASPGDGRASGRASPTVFNPYYTGVPRTQINALKSNGVDRQEIIRRKKAASRSNSPELERRKSPVSVLHGHGSTEPRPRTPGSAQNPESFGMSIERPRSALHRGDFRDREQSGSSFQEFGQPSGMNTTNPILATSPVAPWRPESSMNQFWHISPETRQQPGKLGNAISIPRPQRSRAMSNASLASSFVYKPPTSPLVQSSRPDTPDQSSRKRSRSPDKSRRHTFSPPSFHRFPSHNFELSDSHARTQVPSLRPEKTYPYRAHQPRQSLDLTPYASLSYATLATTRHPSCSDMPLHHAPMVGSYEESILRGRMSTTPSRPLNFVAQLGVLGRGNCKPSLRCPAHVSIPFPAVFYSYGSGSKADSSNDQPSPYVGLIDLENSLVKVESPDKRRKQRWQAVSSPSESRNTSRTREESSTSENQAQRRRRQKQKRRSGSPKAPPGGCYRIPQQGQLQIVIKNPNKTAVKLFLVPYDLSDMESGQKTFIRQRSYSAGPVVDMPLSSRKNLGTDRPEAGINPSGDANDKPMLRYLIHLHICCPAKGRYFLYKSMRVVFANRVPDGKEKLRNEIQLPDPKYSTYKPGRDTSSTATTPISKYGTRRRSAMAHSASLVDDSPWSKLSRNLAQSLPLTDLQQRADVPTQTLPRLPTLESRPASRQMSDGAMEIDSDRSNETRSLQSPLSSPLAGKMSETWHTAGDRTRLDEPFDFENDWSRDRRATPAPGIPGARSESLLSRRLMDLAFYQGRSNGFNEAE